MDKKLFILLYYFEICLSIADHSHVTNNIPIDIICNITRGNLNKADNITLCRVESSISIFNPNAEVNLETPENEKVDGFHAQKKTIYWLPKFDDNQALNLRALSVVGSNLKELTQNCLKSMKNLESLDLTGNDIEKLEKKPFEHNKKLIYINLTQNKIKFIELETFDKLKLLANLHLHNNDCHTNSANAKNKQKVKNLIKTINTSCGKTYKTNDVKHKNVTKSFATTIIFLNETAVTEQSSKYSVLNSSTTSSLTYKVPKSIKIKILLLILVVLFVICIYLVCHIIFTARRNRSQTTIQQLQHNERISLMNNYTTLPCNKPENLNSNEDDSIEMGQRVTSGIYEDILEYQRFQDDTYQSPLDDSSNYIKETTNMNLNIKLNQVELYEKVDDEIYQEIICDDSEALGDSRIVRFDDDTYADPQDVNHQTLEDSYDYEELNLKHDDKNQQNISQESIELDESQTIDHSLESEDLYAETTMENQQEHDLYSTV